MAKHRVKLTVDIVKYDGKIEDDFPEWAKLFVTFLPKISGRHVPAGVWLVQAASGDVFWCDADYYHEMYEPA
jgi:hypothetical protein